MNRPYFTPALLLAMGLLLVASVLILRMKDSRPAAPPKQGASGSL